MVEKVVDRRVDTAGGRDQVPKDLHHRVGAFLLVTVDVVLDEDRHLDVRAVGGQQRLGGDRIGQRLRPIGQPVVVARDLLRRFHGVDDHAVEVAAGVGLADDRERHPSRDARASSFVLELLEQTAERLVRDERKRRALLVGDARAGSRCRAPGLAVGRAEAARDGRSVERCGSWSDVVENPVDLARCGNRPSLRAHRRPQARRDQRERNEECRQPLHESPSHHRWCLLPRSTTSVRHGDNVSACVLPGMSARRGNSRWRAEDGPEREHDAGARVSLGVLIRGWDRSLCHPGLPGTLHRRRPQARRSLPLLFASSGMRRARVNAMRNKKRPRDRGMSRDLEPR